MVGFRSSPALHCCSSLRLVERLRFGVASSRRLPKSSSVAMSPTTTTPTSRIGVVAWPGCLRTAELQRVAFALLQSTPSEDSQILPERSRKALSNARDVESTWCEFVRPRRPSESRKRRFDSRPTTRIVRSMILRRTQN